MFISDEAIKDIMSVQYKLSVGLIERLVGYEDLNFKLQIVKGNSDTGFGHDTVIFKILTPENAERIGLYHDMMSYLYDNGIKTCKPVKTVRGTTFVEIDTYTRPDEDTTTKAVASVLTYIPGETLRTAEHPVSLLEEIGRLAGNVDKLLQNFEKNSTLQPMDSLLELSRVPELELYLDKYCSAEIKELSQQIIVAFKETILPAINLFQKGFIHGDLNDCNIIVSKSAHDSRNYVIFGLIDYGDACVSFYIYEIAILMADLMSVCFCKSDPLQVGRLVLRGYRQEFELNTIELKCLRVVICIRMIQFYVLNSVTIDTDPNNEYAKLDNDVYLAMCKDLWNVSDEQFKQEVID